MKITMKMIADECGVSKSLVSRILNEDTTLRVTPETRRRVLDTVERFGYSRNITALTLATSRVPKEVKRRRIGYVSFTSRKHAGHPYFSHVIEGILEEAARCHTEVVLRISTVEFHNQIKTLLQTYKDDPLDGLILLGKIDSQLVGKAVRQIAKNVVSMDGAFDKNSDYVGTDSAQSVLLGLEHLYKLGHTEFGILYGSNGRRRAACKRWLEEHDLKSAPEWEVFGEYTVDIARERVAEVLKTHKPPRAIVACNDEMAIGCIRALQEAGYRVPEDVAVTGHDDISLAAYVDVPLTTVHIYKREMGRLAVKILLDRVEAGRKVPVSLELAGKLIRRESCGWRQANKGERK